MKCIINKFKLILVVAFITYCNNISTNTMQKKDNISTMTTNNDQNKIEEEKTEDFSSNDWKFREKTSKVLMGLQGEKEYINFETQLNKTINEVNENIINQIEEPIKEKMPINFYENLIMIAYYRGWNSIMKNDTDFFKHMKKGDFDEASLNLIPICYPDFPKINPALNETDSGLLKRGVIQMIYSLDNKKSWPLKEDCKLSEQLNIAKDHDKKYEIDGTWDLLKGANNYRKSQNIKWDLINDLNIWLDRLLNDTKWDCKNWKK